MKRADADRARASSQSEPRTREGRAPLSREKRERARSSKFDVGRVLVLAKRTAYRALVLDDKSRLVVSLLEKSDPTVRRMLASHEAHEATVEEVRELLTRFGVPFDFGGTPHLSRQTPDYDLVVTVGGGGTLLAASHRLGSDTPIFGVNSSPKGSVGFFCGAKSGDVERALGKALAGKLPRVTLTRMQVDLNGSCIHRRVLNEALFCHASPAATSRYILELVNGRRSKVEEQRSSGMFIGPPAGSTAAQKSAGGKILPLTSKRIQYVVREPYQYRGKMKLRVGAFDEEGLLRLRSKMSDAKLFLDGNRLSFDVKLGDVIELRCSPESLTVLGLSRRS